MFNTKRIEELEKEVERLKQLLRSELSDVSETIKTIVKEFGYKLESEDYIGTEGSGPFSMFEEKVVKQRLALKKIYNTGIKSGDCSKNKPGRPKKK